MRAISPLYRRAAAFAAMTMLAGAGAAAAPGSRPHLVVILSDDHSLLDSTVYGATDVRTPNMARLAAAGLTFDRAFVASPSCAPSRAALLTGLMPARNGAEINHSKPRAELKKLPAFLQALGYEVVAFGKVSHYQHTADYGFDHFAHDKFHEHAAIPAAVEWLRARRSSRPLCLLVGSNWPHVPWPEQGAGYDPAMLRLPAGHVDTAETRAMRAKYYAAVERMDADLGTIYDAARSVLGEDTFFLHSSDHGAQWPFAKWNCYEAGIRTPLIAVWPGRIAAGRRTDAMVSWIDFLPTLVEVAGGPAPAGIDGRSFVPVLRGETSRHRDRIFTTHSSDGKMNRYPIRSVRTAEWKYLRNLLPDARFTTHIDLGKPVDGAGYFASWVEAGRTSPAAAAAVARYHVRPAEELYDLRRDPHEQHNLAADPRHAAQLASLRAEVDAWMAAQGDTGRLPVPAPVRAP
jgi:uncharacterized sulfatase